MTLYVGKDQILGKKLRNTNLQLQDDEEVPALRSLSALDTLPIPSWTQILPWFCQFSHISTPPLIPAEPELPSPLATLLHLQHRLCSITCQHYSMAFLLGLPTSASVEPPYPEGHSQSWTPRLPFTVDSSDWAQTSHSDSGKVQP